jgi:hypothetical protein
MTMVTVAVFYAAPEFEFLAECRPPSKVTFHPQRNFAPDVFDGVLRVGYSGQGVTSEQHTAYK